MRFILEDEINLNISGYPWQQRRNQIDIFWKATDVWFTRNFLNNNQIKYVYLPNGIDIPTALKNEVTPIYRQDNIVIYQAK